MKSLHSTWHWGSTYISNSSTFTRHFQTPFTGGSKLTLHPHVRAVSQRNHCCQSIFAWKWMTENRFHVSYPATLFSSQRCLQEAFGKRWVIGCLRGPSRVTETWPLLLNKFTVRVNEPEGNQQMNLLLKITFKIFPSFSNDYTVKSCNMPTEDGITSHFARQVKGGYRHIAWRHVGF